MEDKIKDITQDHKQRKGGAMDHHWTSFFI